MTRREAQEILLSYRPGAEPADDPQVAAALELARTDAGLRQWYEQHRAWDATVRQKLNALPVPADLKASILAGDRVVAGPSHWWNRRAAVLAAAAMIALLITLAVMLVRRPAPATSGGLAQFRDEVVRKVLRNYDMSLETNKVQEIRAHLAQRGAPADFRLPDGLQKLKLAGCGVLTDRASRVVSMVCYEDERNQLVWMFVAKANDMRPPSAGPVFERVVSCATISWFEGDTVYVLASERSEAELRKLL
jgi:uncharacterized membrane protein YbaN (DUF454 family)